MTTLVEITEQSYDVDIFMAYATSENFTGQPVYRDDRCFLHPDAAKALRRAILLAKALGYRFKIYDAFRPASAQWALWEHTPDPEFLTDPRKGSPHSRGVAVDLTLMDSDGNTLDMGTGFDEFSPLSHHAVIDISEEAQRNRFLLLGIMSAAGWDFYANEWWHYQLFHARRYPLLEGIA